MSSINPSSQARAPEIKQSNSRGPEYKAKKFREIIDKVMDGFKKVIKFNSLYRSCYNLIK